MSFVTTLIVAVIGITSYVVLEPVVGRAAADSDFFEITQSITAEISFDTTATDVTMSPTIPGISGGTANGNATVVVSTNNTSGYNMTIQFATGTAMQGDSEGGVINNYSPASASVPDYNFSIGGSGTPGEFAYSVQASTSSDVDPTFLDNGAACGAGSNNTFDRCWFNASTTDGSTPIAETIINRSTETPASGSTTTIHFRVSVPSNPSPLLQADTYTATATLTATTN
ncbi:MAG: hypothetical protein LR017_01470 [Candidatus Pacebacteria bacterium]|nr:hypothetical protein [Candidatus Paceibacterota bacterium]